MGTDRQIDAPARAQQLIRDLHAGRSGTDDEHRAVGQLTRIAVGARVDLHDPCVVGHDRRYHADVGRDRSPPRRSAPRSSRRSSRRGTSRARVSTHREDLDTAPDRRVDLLRVGLEVVRDLVLGRERIRVEVRELETGKAVMPGRSVGDQRVPPLGAPTLGDAMALEDEMRHAARRSGARSSPDRPGRRRRPAPQPFRCLTVVGFMFSIRSACPGRSGR